MGAVPKPESPQPLSGKAKEPRGMGREGILGSCTAPCLSCGLLTVVGGGKNSWEGSFGNVCRVDSFYLISYSERQRQTEGIPPSCGQPQVPNGQKPGAKNSLQVSPERGRDLDPQRVTCCLPGPVSAGSWTLALNPRPLTRAGGILTAGPVSTPCVGLSQNILRFV